MKDDNFFFFDQFTVLCKCSLWYQILWYKDDIVMKWGMTISSFFFFWSIEHIFREQRAKNLGATIYCCTSWKNRKQLLECNQSNENVFTMRSHFRFTFFLAFSKKKTLPPRGIEKIYFLNHAITNTYRKKNNSFYFLQPYFHYTHKIIIIIIIIIVWDWSFQLFEGHPPLKCATNPLDYYTYEKR